MFYVNDVDTLAQKIQSWMSARNVENVFLSKDGECLVSSSRKIMLHRGMNTLAIALDLKEVPTRITTFKDLPQDYLVNKFPRRI